MGGSPISAMPVLSLRLLPPEYVPHHRSQWLVRSSRAIISLAARGARGAGTPRSIAYISSVSRAVIRGSRASNCGQYPTTSRTSLSCVRTLLPSISASPLVGAWSPVIILNVVVLPAPLTPSSPKHSPAPIPSDSPSTASFRSCMHGHGRAGDMKRHARTSAARARGRGWPHITSHAFLNQPREYSLVRSTSITSSGPAVQTRQRAPSTWQWQGHCMK
jgi:hypothetical protein